MKGKILILLCLLASLGGGRVWADGYAGYVAKLVTDPSEIKTDDQTDYLIQLEEGAKAPLFVRCNGISSSPC